MVIKGKVGAAVFIGFLRRLLHNADRPTFVIVDGHPAHKAIAVRKFVDSLNGALRLFLLPPYSPELNPDERVWNDLKNNSVGRKPLTDLASLKTAVVGQLRSIQLSPDRVRGYFRNRTTAYAA